MPDFAISSRAMCHVRHGESVRWRIEQSRDISFYFASENSERLARSLPAHSAFGPPPISRLPKALHSSTSLGMT